MLAEWERQMRFGFPLLSDWNREAATAFDVLADELWGYRLVHRRSAFLVGADGAVAWSHVPTTITSPDEVLAAIAAIAADRG